MTSRLKLAVLTTGRQDWGLLRPLCAALQGDPAFELLLVAGGMACQPRFGDVRAQIDAAGFEVAAEIPWDAEHLDAPEEAAAALSLVAGLLREREPDALVLLGDRYETAAAALAATLCLVPIVHLHGGEETEGAFDNAMRHAITKLAHLHFVAHRSYAERVRQMGEDPSAIHVVGSLGVDNLVKLEAPGRGELERHLGIELKPPIGLVTVHPTTLHEGAEDGEVSAVIGAMERFDATWVITLPNADPGNEEIRRRLLAFASGRERAVAVSALGEVRYLGLMRLAEFVLGNSSSGMTEAPALGIPTINVGDRQRGRLRCESIVDVPNEPEAILAGIERSASPAFRQRVERMQSPYGDGHAAERMLDVLRSWAPPRPPRKVFWGIA